METKATYHAHHAGVPNGTPHIDPRRDPEHKRRPMGDITRWSHTKAQARKKKGGS